MTEALIDTPGLRELLAEEPELFGRVRYAQPYWCLYVPHLPVVLIQKDEAAAVIEKRLREALDALYDRRDWSLRRISHGWAVCRDVDSFTGTIEDMTIGRGTTILAALIAAYAAKGE